MCQTFGIPIVAGGALDQPYALTRAVLDYRAAAEALALLGAEDKERAAEEMGRRPDLNRVLLWMHRAQMGMALIQPGDDDPGIIQDNRSEA